mmetsp:Transcript_9547/g.18610  ORF Transcript_9547/g.18610 Transcript_9547/m.18610 type:complete len:206 (-) Transcript_9547:399-1016(-)
MANCCVFRIPHACGADGLTGDDMGCAPNLQLCEKGRLHVAPVGGRRGLSLAYFTQEPLPQPPRGLDGIQSRVHLLLPTRPPPCHRPPRNHGYIVGRGAESDGLGTRVVVSAACHGGIPSRPAAIRIPNRKVSPKRGKATSLWGVRGRVSAHRLVEHVSSSKLLCRAVHLDCVLSVLGVRRRRAHQLDYHRGYSLRASISRICRIL